jgi:hypothetical protein
MLAASACGVPRSRYERVRDAVDARNQRIEALEARLAESEERLDRLRDREWSARGASVRSSVGESESTSERVLELEALSEELQRQLKEEQNRAKYAAIEAQVLRHKATLLATEVDRLSSFVRPPEVIESRVDGAFDGLFGETVIRLTNGQVWQQVDMQVDYCPFVAPGILIWHDDSGTAKAAIEGIDRSFAVRRIR